MKTNKKKKFLQNLSKFTPFALLYSDPAYGRECLSITAWISNVSFIFLVVSINKLYFIVSAPRIFPLLYKLARPLISEDMKEKIQVAAGNYTFI